MDQFPSDFEAPESDFLLNFVCLSLPADGANGGVEKPTNSYFHIDKRSEITKVKITRWNTRLTGRFYIFSFFSLLLIVREKGEITKPGRYILIWKMKMGDSLLTRFHMEIITVLLARESCRLFSHFPLLIFAILFIIPLAR